jgi:glycine oxidase
MKIVIVGCGVVGAAIAYQLSQIPGLVITVLDRQQPAQASTGAALGVLMAAISQKVKGNNLTMRFQGIRQYDRWIPELEAATSRKIGFNRQGILRLCFEGENLDRWRSLQAIRQGQGWTLELLDLPQLASQYPQLNLSRMIGAVYSPNDRQVDPTALTLALVAAAQQNGVTFQFNAEAIDIDGQGDQSRQRRTIKTIHSTQGAFAADWLVIAAGLGSTLLTTNLQQPVEIRPVLGQAIQVQLSQPLDCSELQPVITGEDVHLVPLGHGQYWIGATVEFPEGAPLNSALHSQTLQPNLDSLEAVWQQAIGLCPGLATATILRQWSGLRPRPEDRPAPVIEVLPGYTNAILASGHYRNGVLLAPATANKVCDIIVNGKGAYC